MRGKNNNKKNNNKNNNNNKKIATTKKGQPSPACSIHLSGLVDWDPAGQSMQTVRFKETYCDPVQLRR